MDNINLTRDADKMICVLYKEYLLQRKSGMSKASAKDFRRFDDWSSRLFPNEDNDDVLETQCEICRMFKMKPYIHGGFVLNDDAIIYMENRFPKGLAELIKYIMQIAPEIISHLIP